MTTTPEYDQEMILEEREQEVEKAARGPVPRWEDLSEVEIAEQEQAEEETHHPARENHEAHRLGAVCGRCGASIEETDDVRLTGAGLWVHEVCRHREIPRQEV